MEHWKETDMGEGATALRAELGHGFYAVATVSDAWEPARPGQPATVCIYETGAESTDPFDDFYPDEFDPAEDYERAVRRVARFTGEAQS